MTKEYYELPKHPSDLFKQAARFGMNAINPITEDYDMFGCADRVREVMALHLS